MSLVSCLVVGSKGGSKQESCLEESRHFRHQDSLPPGNVRYSAYNSAK